MVHAGMACGILWERAMTSFPHLRRRSSAARHLGASQTGPCAKCGRPYVRYGPLPVLVRAGQGGPAGAERRVAGAVEADEGAGGEGFHDAPAEPPGCGGGGRPQVRREGRAVDTRR